MSRSLQPLHKTMPSGFSSRPKAVIGLFPELLGVGGVQEAGRQTAAALNQIARRHGWKLRILSLNDPRGEHQLRTSDPPINFCGFGRNKTSFVLSLIRQGVALQGDGPHLVLAAHPNLALPASLVTMFSFSVRTIVMTHGVEVWKRLSVLKRTALLHANIVVAPSRDTAEKLERVQGVPTARIKRLPWPLSPDFLALTAESDGLALPGAFPRGRVILTVGRWAANERYKGVDDLIEVTARLRSKFDSLNLVVVGGGDDLSRLRELALNRGIIDFVHFLGHVSQEALAACYARADIFAMPSTGEGFGLVFLEAMAFAKPIVASGSGGTVDVVENMVNGLVVPPLDTEELTDALEKLLQDDSLRGLLGQGGARMVRDKYGFEGFVTQLENILKELAPLSASNESL
jgi:phosphatidylinositol alpha-1,6-mannosyltransferase